jgi:hypothetical protein
LDRIDSFPTSGTLLLADRSDLSPPTVAALEGWVKRGGHLIIAAERHLARDPLLRDYGVGVRDGRSAGMPNAAESITLADGTELQVALPRAPILSAERGRLDWAHEVNGGLLMLQLSSQRGRVTVMSSFAPFHNLQLARYQHADLLWHLAGTDASHPVWLVRRLQTQSLPQWLAEHALPALVALAICLAMGLWRVVPRFGPLIVPAPLDRRSLTEHLAAMGRFYASRGQRARLLAQLRDDALEALVHKIPEARVEDGTARLKVAARASGMRARDVVYAFSAPAGTAHDFAAAVRLLREFRVQLARGAPGEAQQSARAAEQAAQKSAEDANTPKSYA